MEEDEELKKIRERRLRRLMKKSFGRKTERTDQQPVKPSLNRPVELTDANFSETIQKHPNVVVDCWAPWCGPCRFLSPIIEELATDYAGKILFGKLNVDENLKVATLYGIMSIPTLVVFKNDVLVDRIIGAMPRRMLEARIRRHL